jgi:uncharacterized membrane protein
MRRSPSPGDAGQAMLPLLVVVALSLLVITFWLLVPWGAATTEKAQAQTAADAAALAAVDGKRKGWVLDTHAPGLDLTTGSVARSSERAVAAAARPATTHGGTGPRSSTARRSGGAAARRSR